MCSRAAHPASADQGLESCIEAALPTGVPGTFSVWCGDISGRPFATRDAEVQHYAASTMKLPLLVAAYRLQERRELDLDRPVLVHNEFSSAADGGVFALSQADDQDDETWARLGEEVPARTLVRHAIVRSGNLATNLVLEQVGTAEVAAVVRDAGCSPATVLPRGIEDSAARESGLDNRVTASDLARIMCGIASGTLASPAACREVEAVLALQQHRGMIPAGLPESAAVANKTGWVTGVAHDVALVRPDGAEPYVLAVCTTSTLTEAEASRVIAEISAVVWSRCVP